MRKQNILILGIAALSSFAVACGGNDTNKAADDQKTEATTSDSKKEEPVKTENLLTDVALLEKAEAELRAMPKFSGKDMQVFQNVNFYKDGRITIALQDPGKPENIDEYHFSDGKWGAPQAVQISGSGKMDDNVWPLSKIKFSTVATVYKNWNEKAQSLEGGANKELTSIDLLFWVPSQEVRWSTSNVETDREKYSIEYNLDGSVKEFKKS
ncbi:MAG: hypothetical protein EOP54_10735 [Sphingobacteriales bacterium]|nr:MAG: hypothetical protein EOP54_10735 [Sphingobacteriales bacterium]